MPASHYPQSVPLSAGLAFNPRLIRRGFAQIFFGLFLTWFDPNYDAFGHFDLAPNFIGYGLIALGLSKLISLSTQFSIARLWAWALIPLSVIFFFAPVEPVSSIATIIRGLIEIGFSAAMMWPLLSGIKAYSTRHDWSALATLASNCRFTHVLLACAAMPLLIISPLASQPVTGNIELFTVPELRFLGGLLVTAGYLFLSVMILQLIYRIRARF